MDKNAPFPTLPMQLMLAMGTWLASPSAWRCASAALPNWNPGAAASEALQKAVAREAKNRADELLSGILRYIEAPYARDVAEPPAIWKKGNARLLDYGVSALSHRERGGASLGEGPHPARDASHPLPEGEGCFALFVPSLINRYYILDLEKERSLLRYMAAQGIYPLVLDWDAPGEFEKEFGCEEYVTQILLPAIDFLHQATGRKISLVGYCMGGVLALAAAQLAKSKISSLALLATPWDFHCKSFKPFVVDKPWRETIASLIASQETLRADVIQSLFYLTDPFVFGQKFRRFSGLDPDGRAARDFVALERWVNDGVPMTANMAKDCLVGWAQENQLADGGWSVGGKKIDPKKITCPTFIAIPDHDHVVPKDCAMPLADAMKQAEIIHPGAGHVGMVMGTKAKRELWQPLAEWIKNQ